MQTDRIIEKAKKLGLDIGNSDSQLDNLRTIASQVGLHDINDLNELERVLDEQIEYNSQVVEPQTMDENPSVRNEKFGQRQYDQAKNKDGIYDKNYYKDRQDELNKKANKLNEERKRNVKTSSSEGNVLKPKTKMNRVLDNLNYANAKKNCILPSCGILKYTFPTTLLALTFSSSSLGLASPFTVNNLPVSELSVTLIILCVIGVPPKNVFSE